MPQSHVSKTLAFAAQNGEYWQEFVVQQPEFRPDEVTPEEEDAIRAAREHVREAVVDLLEAVMEEVRTRAGNDPWLAQLKFTRRRSTMEEGLVLSLPLVIAASWEAQIVFPVATRARGESGSVVKLFPALWRQSRRGPTLDAVANEMHVKLVIYGQYAYVADAGIELVEGAAFAQLATQAVDAIWELALAFRDRIVPRAAATAHAGG